MGGLEALLKRVGRLFESAEQLTTLITRGEAVNSTSNTTAAFTQSSTDPDESGFATDEEEQEENFGTVPSISTAVPHQRSSISASLAVLLRQEISSHSSYERRMRHFVSEYWKSVGIGSVDDHGLSGTVDDDDDDSNNNNENQNIFTQRSSRVLQLSERIGMLSLVQECAIDRLFKSIDVYVHFNVAEATRPPDEDSDEEDEETDPDNLGGSRWQRTNVLSNAKVVILETNYMYL